MVQKRITTIIPLLTLISLLLASSFVGDNVVKANTQVVENSWVSKAPVEVARSNLGVASVGDKIYAIGGSDVQQSGMAGSGGVVGTNEEYDPSADAWSYQAGMPTPREGFATAVLDNALYCIGGLSSYGAESAVNEVYYPTNNSWSTKASLPAAEEGMQANALDGKIYLTGKNLYLSGINSTVTYIYDPITDSWNTQSPLPNNPSGGPASCVLDGKIYVISSYLTQVYDPTNDSWYTVAPLPVSMTYPVAVSTTGTYAPKEIYVFYEDSLEIYNPQTDSWTTGSGSPATITNPGAQGVTVLTDREFYGATVLNDTIYTIGGRTITYPANVPVSDYQVGNILEDSTNEQYIPLGYGTVQPTTTSTPTVSSTPAVPELSFLAIIPLSAVILFVAVKLKQRKTVNLS